MKLIAVCLFIIIPFLSHDICSIAVLLLSLVWMLYYIKNFKLYLSNKDEKTIVNDTCIDIPNNNAGYYIRYLYKGNADEKIFMLHILELLVNKELSITKNEKSEYLIENNNTGSVLTKSEEKIKNIFFDCATKDDKISLTKFNRLLKKQSGYMYNAYKDFVNTFTFEAAKLKYMKTIKSLEDSMLFFFIFSMILSVYNLIFTSIVIFIFMFILTTILIVLVNNNVNREKDAIEELKKWLGFKNYIDSESSNINNLDYQTLERYALYSYALDSFESFKRIINRCEDEKINNSNLLKFIKTSEFYIIENYIVDGLKKCKRNVILLLMD